VEHRVLLFYGILTCSESNNATFIGCLHGNFHGKLQTIPKDNNKYLVFQTPLMKNSKSFSTMKR